MNIYLIANTVNQKVYIGITSKTIEKRLKGHCKDSKGKDPRSKLHNAMFKYGVDKFFVRLLEVVDSFEAACDKERYYIQLYNSYHKGYNTTLGGEGVLGLKVSKETRLLISKRYSGQGNPMFGRVHPMKGKRQPEGMGEKIRQARIKDWQDPIYINNQVEKHTGKVHTEEAKEKIRAKHIGLAVYGKPIVVGEITYPSRKSAKEALMQHCNLN